MDVIELLVADHNRARGLFASYHDAEEAGKASEASELAGRIIDELTAHMEAEEATFYRAVNKESEAIEGDVDEGYEEHHVAKILIGEIQDLPPGSDTWVAKMTVLIESVEHHIDEEEEELFPSVRSATSSEFRQGLGAEFDSRKVALGATGLDEKSALTTSDLRQKASDQEIPGRSKMDHDELAATVEVD